MSNDLISRSAVLDIIKKHECDTSRMMSGVIELPTAYDVDKVTYRLMCESINCHIMTDRAVEIVKSGGIE